METLRDLMARHAHPGTVTWIGLRPARRADVVSVDHAIVTEAGLDGDRHPSPGKRAVTLFQMEYLPVIAATVGRDVTPDMLRRNIAISGVNLNGLKGRDVAIGPVHLRITGPCMPCSRMEEVLGPGGYTALRGHGGWCAAVLRCGQIALGDKVMPL